MKRMLLTEIQTGTRLELEVYTEENDKIDIVFVSKFEQALSDQFAVINAPLYEGVVYPIRIGWILHVYFFSDGKLYMFDSKVIDRITRDNMSFLKIEKTGNIIRIQRRHYYRFECALPVEYRKFDCANFQDKKEEKPFSASITRNISGGGICILLNEDMSINQLVECKLKLQSNTIINFLGRIVRTEKLEHNINYKFEAGIAFEIIDNNDKETIIKYIFRQQRELRKKGLI
ncbi:MAG: flagellar brake protein [Firmicutes bacterium]|nr:flagellar brake protein [Bacillota bacterium]